MNTPRSYQILPDRGVCMQPGCPWRHDGPGTETVAEAHSQGTGHETRVTTSAVVIFGSHHDTPAQQAARRAVLAGGHG